MKEFDREINEWFVTGMIFIALVVLLPQPPIATIEGERVIQISLWGWLLPQWAIVVLGCIPFLLIKQIVHVVGRGFRRTGSKVASKHHHPPQTTYDGAVHFERYEHPLNILPAYPEYTPWTFDKDTTAEDFMAAKAPSHSRALFMDTGAAMAEYEEFQERQMEWVRQASEEQLRELVPLAERMAREGPSWNAQDVFDHLLTANGERGIPTMDELKTLARQLEHEGRGKMDFYELSGPPT
jgi:hypothetical protein